MQPDYWKNQIIAILSRFGWGQNFTTIEVEDFGETLSVFIDNNHFQVCGKDICELSRNLEFELSNRFCDLAV